MKSHQRDSIVIAIDRERKRQGLSLNRLQIKTGINRSVFARAFRNDGCLTTRNAAKAMKKLGITLQPPG